MKLIRPLQSASLLDFSPCPGCSRGGRRCRRPTCPHSSARRRLRHCRSRRPAASSAGAVLEDFLSADVGICFCLWLDVAFDALTPTMAVARCTLVGGWLLVCDVCASAVTSLLSWACVLCTPHGCGCIAVLGCGSVTMAGSKCCCSTCTGGGCCGGQVCVVAWLAVVVGGGCCAAVGVGCCGGGGACSCESWLSMVMTSLWWG